MKSYALHSFFFFKNVVFPAQAEYSYFSADFRLKIFLYYSQLVYVFCGEYCTHVLYVLFIELSLALNILLYIASAGFFVLLASFAVQRKE